MRSSLAFLGSSLAVTAVALWSGCGSSSPSSGGGGQTTTTTTRTTSSIGTGGGGTCAGPSPDGMCEPSKGEDCSCEDCQVTALCNPGQCSSTDGCDHMLDSCVCPSCAEDSFCGDPGLGNCNDGGACDPYTEGCHCPNCWTYDACKPSVAACSGGVPNHKCETDKGEDCSCVDCQGTPMCVPCLNSGQCVPNEPCSCADCAKTKACTDPANCVDDGVCAILHEGCGCNDCKDLPECAPWVGDAGLDAALDAADAGD